jgi:hypothetical protein
MVRSCNFCCRHGTGIVLDLSVEHLSTFFRFLRFDLDMRSKQNDYNKCISTLQNYTQRVMYESPYHRRSGQSSSSSNDTVPIELRQTIAIIPFGLKSVFRENVDPDHKIRYESLLATLASMWQIGIGRAVIVGGTSDEESDAVQNIIFKKFDEMIDESSSSSQTIRPIMELAFVGGNSNTQNLPREAIQGIQYVFNRNVTLLPTQSIDEVTIQWLGTNDLNKFRYVYFTEPDLLLNTRPRTIPYIANELRNGNIIMAHRLQLIQHGSDFPNFADTSLIIPAMGSFANVTTLDSMNGDGCLLLGRNDKAGLKAPRCRKLWWRCGFGHSKQHNYSDVKQIEKLFHLYKSFELIRLKHGTGFTTIAGTQQRSMCEIMKGNATSITTLPSTTTL